jgi:hypothetical protein
MKTRPVRMTDAEWAKCKELGGSAWIRTAIKRAKVIANTVEEPAPSEVVYTHSTAEGGVFYVGRGRPSRATNFQNRSAAHKAIVAAVGRSNVVVEIVWRSSPASEKSVVPIENSNYKEIEMVAIQLAKGARLCNVLTHSMRLHAEKLAALGPSTHATTM